MDKKYLRAIIITLVLVITGSMYTISLFNQRISTVENFVIGIKSGIIDEGLLLSEQEWEVHKDSSPFLHVRVPLDLIFLEELLRNFGGEIIIGENYSPLYKIKNYSAQGFVVPVRLVVKGDYVYETSILLESVEGKWRVVGHRSISD